MATLAGNTIASTYALLLKIDSSGIDGTLRKVEDGDATDSALSISTTAIAVDATDKIYFDGGGNTYMYESSADIVDFYAGGSGNMWRLDGASDNIYAICNTFNLGDTTLSSPRLVFESDATDVGTGDIDNTFHVIRLGGNNWGTGTIVMGPLSTAGSWHKMEWNASSTKTLGSFTHGVDDAGYDHKWFGNTASHYMMWDTSADNLLLMGGAHLGIGNDPGVAQINILSPAGANARIDLKATDEHSTFTQYAGANNKSNFMYFGYSGNAKGQIKFENDASDAANIMSFNTGDNDVNNLSLLGSGFTGIMDISPKAVLEVNGINRGAGLEPIILVDGHSSNGFSMLGDNYIDGTEQHISIGCEYSTGALFLANKVTGAIDQQTSPADGWKSTPDLSVSGAAVVIDGNSGQFEFWHAENATTTAMDSTKTLTRAFKIDMDGDTTLGDATLTAADSDSYRLGVGRTDPTYKLDVLQNKSSSYAARFMNDGNNDDRHGIKIQCGAYNASSVSPTAATTYLAAVDGDGNDVGSLNHNTSGNFVISATSDARLKENIADTKVDGLAICNQIKVREFNWIGKGGLKNEAGFIAQEVQEIWAPAAGGTDGAMKQKLVSEAVEAVEAVEEVIDNDPDSKHYGRIVVNAEPAVEGKEAVYEEVIDPMTVSEESFIPVMMKAIQQLSDKVTALENA